MTLPVRGLSATGQRSLCYRSEVSLLLVRGLSATGQRSLCYRYPSYVKYSFTLLGSIFNKGGRSHPHPCFGVQVTLTPRGPYENNSLEQNELQTINRGNNSSSVKPVVSRHQNVLVRQSNALSSWHNHLRRRPPLSPDDSLPEELPLLSLPLLLLLLPLSLLLLGEGDRRLRRSSTLTSAAAFPRPPSDLRSTSAAAATAFPRPRSSPGGSFSAAAPLPPLSLR